MELLRRLLLLLSAFFDRLSERGFAVSNRLGPSTELEIENRPDLRECSGTLRPGDRRKILDVSGIVIHRNTASHTHMLQNPEFKGSHVEALHAFHSEGKWRFRIFPYHYFVDRDGQVTQVHDEMTVSPHAGHLNQQWIGIALNIDGRKEPPTSEQWNSLVPLCAAIKKRYGPDSTDIIGHSLRKRCPGPKVDLASLRTDVDRHLSPERERINESTNPNDESTLNTPKQEVKGKV